MQILVVNPNTSKAFTAKIEKVARRYAHAGTEIIIRTATSGPRSIESIYDEVLSAPGTLQAVLPDLDKVDGVIVACYSDHPAVYALREITEKPILGIAEASMLVACMLGHSFSIITTNEEWEPLLWDAVRHYGLAERCASIRSTGLPVLAFENLSSAKASILINKAAKAALDTDHSEVICLGCAGMAGLDKQLEATLKVPVLDGVACAVKLMEALIGYGSHTSKKRTYHRPHAKELINLSRDFTQGYSKN